jgi:protease PrsW
LLAVISFVLAILPVSIYLWAVWAMDRYEREPARLIFTNFLWGALGAISIVIFFTAILSVFIPMDLYFRAVVIAPVCEELTKGVFLFRTARKNQFDNTTDGIVYGMAIGLGFGMTENFLYFLSAISVEDWIFRVVFRSLFTVVIHALATGMLGACIGSSKYSKSGVRFLAGSTGLTAAICIHTIWNWSLSSQGGALFIFAILFFFVCLFLELGLLQLSLSREKKMLYSQLWKESLAGLIPAEHVQFLISYRMRKFAGWFYPEAEKKKYIELVTHLAFLRSRLHRLNGDARLSAEEEIATVRGIISGMIDSHRDSTNSKL